MRFANIALAVLFLANVDVHAQSRNALPVPDSLFYGIWKGTSICQIKSSPCRDENVVYHIAKSGKENLIEIKANKIVNGAEEEMGTIDFRYDPKTREIISVSQPNAIWKFKKDRNSISGTLMYKGELFRIIQLTKQN
jgi:hypothetical protein